MPPPPIRLRRPTQLDLPPAGSASSGVRAPPVFRRSPSTRPRAVRAPPAPRCGVARECGAGRPGAGRSPQGTALGSPTAAYAVSPPLCSAAAGGGGRRGPQPAARAGPARRVADGLRRGLVVPHAAIGVRLTGPTYQGRGATCRCCCRSCTARAGAGQRPRGQHLLRITSRRRPGLSGSSPTTWPTATGLPIPAGGSGYGTGATPQAACERPEPRAPRGFENGAQSKTLEHAQRRVLHHTDWRGLTVQCGYARGAWRAPRPSSARPSRRRRGVSLGDLLGPEEAGVESRRRCGQLAYAQLARSARTADGVVVIDLGMPGARRHDETR